MAEIEAETEIQAINNSEESIALKTENYVNTFSVEVKTEPEVDSSGNEFGDDKSEKLDHGTESGDKIERAKDDEAHKVAEHFTETYIEAQNMIPNKTPINVALEIGENLLRIIPSQWTQIKHICQIRLDMHRKKLQT